MVIRTVSHFVGTLAKYHVYTNKKNLGRITLPMNHELPKSQFLTRIQHSVIIHDAAKRQPRRVNSPKENMNFGRYKSRSCDNWGGTRSRARTESGQTPNLSVSGCVKTCITDAGRPRKYGFWHGPSNLPPRLRIALATRVLKVIEYRLNIRCELKLAVPGEDVCNLHVLPQKLYGFTATIQDITKPRKLRQESIIQPTFQRLIRQPKRN